MNNMWYILKQSSVYIMITDHFLEFVLIYKLRQFIKNKLATNLSQYKYQ